MSVFPVVVLALIVLAAVAVWAHNFVTGDNLVRDYLDTRRNARQDLAALDAAWVAAGANGRSTVVVSLSTIPSRVPHLGATLKSLLHQTRLPAEIRLNVPKFSKREQVAYEVPQWIRALKSVNVVECDTDWGPATKFIPSLLALPPDTVVLVVDDDRIYPKELVADMEAAAKADSNAAACTIGWICPADMTDRPTNFSNIFPRPPAPIMSTRIRRRVEVDILKGVSGYIVRPRFFDLAQLTDYSAAPPEAFFVDDVWISGLCKAKKFVIPTKRTNFHPKTLAGFYGDTSLGRMDVDKSRNTAMLKYFGADGWTVGGPKHLDGSGRQI